MAGVEFKFTGAMLGSGGRALDLVLLIDTTTGDFGERDGNLVRQRIEGLSRALDVTGSRYVLTAILAGAILVEGVVALSEICRVLLVDGIPLNDEGKPIDETAKLRLDDSIRVLLPLSLPRHTGDVLDEAPSAIEQLINALTPQDGELLIGKVVDASKNGTRAVTDAMAALIDEALTSEIEEDSP
jgi:hypothetical protein